MTEKWDECASEILEKLEVKERRMQNIEIKHTDILAFEKNFIEFQKKFNQTSQKLENLRDLPRFIER